MFDLFRLFFYRLFTSFLCIFRFFLNLCRFIKLLKLAKIPSPHKKRIILGGFVWIFKVRLSLKLVFGLQCRISLVMRHVDHWRIGRHALNRINRGHVKKEKIVCIGHFQGKHVLRLTIFLCFSRLGIQLSTDICAEFNVHHLHLLELFFRLLFVCPKCLKMFFKSRFVDLFQFSQQFWFTRQVFKYQK
jgi:hypothetical protein